MPVCTGAAAGGSTMFWRRFQKVPGGFGAGAGSGSRRFRKMFWRRFLFNEVPEKVLEGVGGEPGQVQRLSGKACGEFPEGIGHVQQGSGRFRRRFRKMLAQSQARFNEVPEGSGEGFEEGSGTPWCRGGPGSTRVQVGSGAIPGVCRRSF